MAIWIGMFDHLTSYKPFLLRRNHLTIIFFNFQIRSDRVVPASVLVISYNFPGHSVRKIDESTRHLLHLSIRLLPGGHMLNKT